MKTGIIHSFVQEQLSSWPLAADNFKALEKVHVREVQVNGLTVRLQFNPARMISSAAKLTKADIARRPCFLCEANRPDVQTNIPFESPAGNQYHILVNPYPIFPDHLVIALKEHKAQSIMGRCEDMLALAQEFEGYTLFYNGPCCGASAPDHHHFQAAPRGLMALEAEIDAAISEGRYSGTEQSLTELYIFNDAALYHYDRFSTGIFAISSKSQEAAIHVFYKLLEAAEIQEGDTEPRINLYSWWTGNEYRT